MLEQLLPLQQQQIVARAASRIKKQSREAFRKYVLDILRGKTGPTNTDVRHAAGAGIVKYGRRI